MRRTLLLLLSSAFLLSAATPIDIRIDLTDAPRKLFHAQLAIPVQPGPLTLAYPQWIPGEHSPSGPVGNVAGLIFHAGNENIPWRRDDVNMFLIHVIVPAGITFLNAQLDFLATSDPTGFSAGASTTPNLAVLNWSEVLLYPSGPPAKDIEYRPALKLPVGWHFGTALKSAAQEDGYQQFSPVALNTLIDSPVLAGRYFREVPLAPEIQPKHYLDIAADDPANLEITDEQTKGFSALVREAGALFASRHYDSYHFLLTLSDSVAHFGLEHHQSSDDRADAKTLVDEDFAVVNADLLPHEFVHSWNGKYRRPAGLVTPDYQQPMKGELLWVYEGLTQYYGDVLATRSGLRTPEQFRSYLAQSAAEQDHRPGRTWRDLEDTAVAAQILYDSQRAWDNWRRSTDFYPEGELLWLDADTTIRRLTAGKKSLDDFCAAFYGVGGNTEPALMPYSFADLVHALNDVAPNDWAKFLRDRLQSRTAEVPEHGIQQSGYHLVYKPEANEYIRASESRKGGTNAWYSLGLNVGSDTVISDVLMDSPAFRAGLGPGMKIVAVDGLRMSDESLRAAIRKSATEPIELIIENQDTFRVVQISYRGPERYPALEPIPNAADMLKDILKPRVSAPAKSPTA